MSDSPQTPAAGDPPPPSLWSVYADWRMLWVFLMGAASGFPWVLIGSAMSGWLTDAGLTRTGLP